MNSNPAPALVEVRDLVKVFEKKRSFRPPLRVRAVDGVSFSIRRGETFGLVGESGCGKSTLGRTIMRIYEPTAGKLLFAGDDITTLSEAALAPYRSQMQIVFQDPYSSLNPSMRVRDIVAEPLLLKEGNLGADERDARVEQMLLKVGLSGEDMRKFPNEFSGGQRQRIGIARALIVNPAFILCDEPISALDVSIQAQVVNLLCDLQAERGLSYLFVAHDLSMVRHISTRIGVMYAGRLCEIAGADEIYTSPAHPYTQTLLAAIPLPNPQRAREKLAREAAASAERATPPASGCPFSPRCPRVQKRCFSEAPALRPLSAAHEAACFALF